MQYFILPLALIVLFELIGNIISNKYNLTIFKLDIVLGFSIVFATYEIPAFLFSYFHAKFIFLFLFTLLFIFVWLVYVFLNRKQLKIKINKNELVIFLLIIIIQLLFTTRYTVGSLFRFDTLTYANYITDNIYSSQINTIGPHNGFPSVNYGYGSQSIYLMASALYYLMRGVLTKIGFSFYYLSQHTWCYSIILYFIHAEMLVNIVSYFKPKKKLTYLLIFIFINLFMFNFYWNSQQAYLGNSYRMALTSYMFVFVYEYFKNSDNKNLWLFLVFTAANVACANANSTLACIFVFGVWALVENNKESFKILILSLVIPIMCLVYQLTSGSIYTFLLPLVVIAISCLDKQIIWITDKLKLKVVLPLLVGILLIAGSYYYTRDLFFFGAIFDNLSGWSDMTWDYFDYSYPWMISANIVYYVILVGLFLLFKDNKAIKVLVLITLIFFNPFAGQIQVIYMWTFYRNYDIVINFATIIYVFHKLEDLKWSDCLLGLLILLSGFAAYGQINYLVDPFFEKPEGYNEIARMTNDQTDVIDNVKAIMDTNNLDEVYAITYMPNLRTEIPSIKTLYGRNKEWNAIEEDFELLKIFYPVDHYADEFRPGEPDLINMCEYIKDSKYKLIVQDKNIDYYDEEKGVYMSYTYLVNECGTYPAYENDNYAIYYYADK